MEQVTNKNTIAWSPRQYQTEKKSKREVLLFVTSRADVYLTEVKIAKAIVNRR